MGPNSLVISQEEKCSNKHASVSLPTLHSCMPACILFLQNATKPWDATDGAIWDQVDDLWMDRLRFQHKAQNIDGPGRRKEMTYYRKSEKALSQGNHFGG